MHVCSAYCATSSGGCCGKNKMSHHDHKDCCDKPSKYGKKGHDCQNIHLSFFNSTGKFGFEKPNDALKIYQISISPIIYFFSLPIVKFKNSIAFSTGFHPPPQEDTRILIHSFQI